MPDVPVTAQDYTKEDLELVKAGCLTVACKLGSLMNDIVIVGGSVPTLLIDMQKPPSTSFDPWDGAGVLDNHVGTRDLDIGFSVALLDDQRYKELSLQLRQAGFVPDTNDKGNQALQRWKFKKQPRLKVDFLIPPIDPEDRTRSGKPKHLESDFAATITPGLNLALESPVELELEGQTLRGAAAKKILRVCEPAAFIILKGLAIRLRGKDKDEYDIVYVLRNHPDGLKTIATTYSKYIHRKEPEAITALENLEEDFAKPENVGPVAVSQFVYGYNDLDLQADASAFVRQFVETVKSLTE